VWLIGSKSILIINAMKKIIITTCLILLSLAYLSGQNTKWAIFKNHNGEISDVRVSSYEFLNINLFEDLNYELQNPSSIVNYKLGKGNLILFSQSETLKDTFGTSFIYDHEMNILEIDRHYFKYVYDYLPQGLCKSTYITYKGDTLKHSEFLTENNQIKKYTNYFRGYFTEVEYFYNDDGELIEHIRSNGEGNSMTTKFIKLSENSHLEIVSREGNFTRLFTTKINELTVEKYFYIYGEQGELNLRSRKVDFLDECGNATKSINYNVENGGASFVTIYEYTYLSN